MPDRTGFMNMPREQARFLIAGAIWLRIITGTLAVELMGALPSAKPDSRMTLLANISSCFPSLRLALFAFGFSLLSSPCGADSNYLVDVWTPYEGLPQSRVLSIAQTPDGYLWVSTQLGWLARFDGIRFDHFNPSNTPALVSPEIQKLLVDDRGTLWIGDIDGRIISHSEGKFRARTTDKPGYRRRIIESIGRHDSKNRFMSASGTLIRVGGRTTYENEDNPIMASPNAIRQFCQDSTGHLWCRTNGGVLGLWGDGALQPPGEDGIPPGLKVNHLLAIPGGGLWLATNDGLWKRKAGVFSKSSLNLPSDIKSLDRLAMNHDGSLWILSGNSLMLVRDGGIDHTTILQDLGVPNQGTSHEIHSDSDCGAWILKSGAGIWHVESTGGFSVLNTGNGLPSNLVDAWFEDREKNIWLGTAAGLVRIRPRWFHVIDTDSDSANTGVVSISEDAGGNMWLGRADGLTRWRDGVSEDVPLPSIREDFPITEVTIAPGEFPNEVWLGTVQTGAFLLDNGRVRQPFPFPAPGLAIRVVRRDPEGGIWFGGEFGLFRWNGKKLQKFGPEDGLRPGHIHDISFDSEGAAWIAKGEDLLSVYRDGRFETVPMPGLPGSLRLNTVLCGRDGNVWLGSVGAGLIHLSCGKLFNYTTEDGLPADSVSQLLEDDDGYLWGGTIRGIFRVSTTALDMRSKGIKPSALFQNYDHSDGLPTSECSGGFQPASWKASDGKLWFATATSAVVLDPGQVRKNLAPPTTIIEQMRVAGNDVNITRSNGKRTTHHISPGRHRYEFMFTGLSFTAPEKVRFQWRLDGVDSDWIDGKTQRSVAYSGLDPGNYQFAVRASNNDGIWARQPATVHFTVSPHYWQRSSVRIATGIACLALGYLVITGIMRRKHARELKFLEYERSLELQSFRHKAAMEAERSRIAAELHDDLGANLTQIQWLGEAAARPAGSSTGETELIGRITRKSREMVRLIDQIVWAVNPKNDTLEQLVTYVCNFAEQYFRDSTARCRIDVAEDIPAHELKADVRHHLFLIAKEALHNVAKHAATDRVWIRVTYNEPVFKLVIEDRGRGFDPTSAAAGDGLLNMRNRARKAGAELDIESSPGEGTKVTLVLNLDPQSN